jgi:hypothetical protein
MARENVDESRVRRARTYIAPKRTAIAATVASVILATLLIRPQYARSFDWVAARTVR